MATPPVQSPDLPPLEGPRARHVVAIVALAVGSDLVAVWLVRWLFPALAGLAFDVLSLSLATAVGVPLLWFVILRPFHRSAVAERALLEGALRAARAAEAHHRAFIETTLEGVVILGPDGRMTFANPRIGEMLGCAPHEMLGRSLADFMDEEARASTRLAAGRRSGAGQAERYDARFRRRDGTDLWAVVSATPLPTRPGEPGGVLALLSDITERKRAEDEAARLAAAFDQAADAVFITDPDGMIVWVNGAFERITGYPRPEAVGKTPRILKSGSHEPEFYADLWKTIRGGRVFRGMMINRHRSGTRYFLDTTITPILNDAGRITHFVAAGRAITAQSP